jgi:hypothetical protein
MIGSVLGAAPPAAAVTASVEAGVLTVRDDAGASTDVFVAPYSDPAGGASFYAVMAKHVSTAQTIGACWAGV